MVNYNLKKADDFKDFCEIGINRMEFLIAKIQSFRIPYSVITIENSKNIILFPNNLVTSTDSNVLLAHYDRVPKTPGANDNSASVFYLLKHASDILEIDHNIVIIFTDQEEIGGKESVTLQGSFKLGEYFKSKKIRHLSFYVFDMCGIGDTIVIGTAGESLIKEHYKENYHNSLIKNKIELVKKSAEDILLSVNYGEFFYATPLFSDDLGLILNEYPAILVSLLPYHEVIKYKDNSKILPLSWQNNHTLKDSIDTLSADNWKIIKPLLNRLSGISKNDDFEGVDNAGSFLCSKRSVEYIKFNFTNEDIINYIKNPLYTLPINPNKVEMEFLLFSSELTPLSIKYFIKECGLKGPDLDTNIFNYINKRVIDSYKLLPLKIKRVIEGEYAKCRCSNITDFFYQNVIKYIPITDIVNGRFLDKKNSIHVTFKSLGFNSYKGTISDNNSELGFIKLQCRSGVCQILEVNFTPEILYSYDQLNMLKGIKKVLINNAKLMDNDALEVNLSRSNWKGCLSLFRIIKLELDGRVNIKNKNNFATIWKRYKWEQR